MECNCYSDLKEHVGHTIHCILQVKPNVIQFFCETCNRVISSIKEEEGNFFQEYLKHVGHTLECIEHSSTGIDEDDYVQVICKDCNKVLIGFDDDYLGIDRYVCGVAFTLSNDSEDEELTKSRPCFCPYCGTGDPSEELEPIEEEYTSEELDEMANTPLCTCDKIQFHHELRMKLAMVEYEGEDPVTYYREMISMLNNAVIVETLNKIREEGAGSDGKHS